MRIHLLAPPNAQTTKAYCLDGFAQMTIRFARILKEYLGAEVILYASEENDAPCDELVTVITKEELDAFQQLQFTEKGAIWQQWPYQVCFWDERSPIFQLANVRAARAIAQRKRPKDYICSIHGGAQKIVADAHPDLAFVEYSIGYSGTFAKYRVYESQAWRHHNYGVQQTLKTMEDDVRNFDTVIPCFYDPDEYPFRDQKAPFALYCGRIVPRKGIEIACRAAKAAGLPLKLIGYGDPSIITYGEYMGVAKEDQKKELLARAQVVIIPTTYMEPFNQVGVEAQLCGTPVVATDHGGFTETIEQGKTGFRCHYLGEYVDALQQAKGLDHAYIRQRAVELYSLETAAAAYEAYFKRLDLLWDKGWETV